MHIDTFVCVYLRMTPLKGSEKLANRSHGPSWALKGAITSKNREAIQSQGMPRKGLQVARAGEDWPSPILPHLFSRPVRGAGVC